MSHPILLIEDNEQNRYLATFLLERRGYRVVSVADGRTGLELAQTLVPKLILLDIQLPALAATPIIAVTSYAMVGDREKSLAAGCNGYIEKPINPETFTAEIIRFDPQPPPEPSAPCPAS